MFSWTFFLYNKGSFRSKRKLWDWDKISLRQIFVN